MPPYSASVTQVPVVWNARRSDEAVCRQERAHEHARKIRPEFTRGPLVRVGWGRNQAEAELIRVAWDLPNRIAQF